MLKFLGKNGRTTLLGILSAVSLLMGNRLNLDGTSNPNAAPITTENVITSVFLAALGIASADSKKEN